MSVSSSRNDLPAETSEYEEVFHTFDKEGSGMVNEWDLVVMLRTMGYVVVEEEVVARYLTTHVDVGKDRMIHLTDFLQLIHNLETEEKHEFEGE